MILEERPLSFRKTFRKVTLQHRLTPPGYDWDRHPVVVATQRRAPAPCERWTAGVGQTPSRPTAEAVEVAPVADLFRSAYPKESL